MQEQAKIFPEKLVKSKSINMVTVVLIALGITFGSYPKVAIFSTNVDAENQTLINHKCVCGALNHHFCQTPVSTSFFHSLSINLYSSSASVQMLALLSRINSKTIFVIFSWSKFSFPISSMNSFDN